MRSRVTWRAIGRRAARFFSASAGAFGNASSDSAAGWVFRHSSSNNPDCSIDSFSLLRARCASRSSRIISAYLFFSEDSRSSCSARSSTIFFNVSASFGSELGSSGKIQVNRNRTQFQENVLTETEKRSDRAPVAFAPAGGTQIDAAQKRAELLWS